MIYDAPATPPVVATPATLNHLRRAKPWVRFISVMTFIGAAFMMLGGLFITLMGSSIPGFSEAGIPYVGGALGIVYLLLALLYLFPGLFLWRYANAIDSLLRNQQSVALEEAMKHQTSFWRFVGIMMAVILVIYLLIFLGAIVFGALGAMGS
jgi:hypothetical protein